jgi:hypothetical protein
VKPSAAAAAIRDTRPFTSGPLVGVRVSERLYLVQSYGDTIAAIVRDVGYLVTVDPPSPTSGRHAGQVRAAWQGIAYLDVGQPVLDSAVRRNT